MKHEVNYNSLHDFLQFSHNSSRCILSLGVRFSLKFYYGSLTIPGCPDIELLLYTEELIIQMIDEKLQGPEWEEVLKLDKLPPLPVDPSKLGEDGKGEKGDGKDDGKESSSGDKEHESGILCYKLLSYTVKGFCVVGGF